MGIGLQGGQPQGGKGGGGKGGGGTPVQQGAGTPAQQNIAQAQSSYAANAGAKPPPPNYAQAGYQSWRGGIADIMQRYQQHQQANRPPPGTLNATPGQPVQPVNAAEADLRSGVNNFAGGDMRGTNTAAPLPSDLPAPAAPTTTAPNPTTPPTSVNQIPPGIGQFLRGKGGKGGGGGFRGGMPMRQKQMGYAGQDRQGLAGLASSLGFADGGKVSWSLPPMAGAPTGNVAAVPAAGGSGPSMFGDLKMSGFTPMAPAVTQKYTPVAPVTPAATTTKSFKPSIQAQFLLGMGVDPKLLLGKNYDAWASQPVTNAMYYSGRQAKGRSGPR